MPTIRYSLHSQYKCLQSGSPHIVNTNIDRHLVQRHPKSVASSFSFLEGRGVAALEQSLGQSCVDRSKQSQRIWGLVV